VKYLSAVFLALAVIAGCATPNFTAVKEEDKTFSQVYETPGYNKDSLFEKVKIWIATNFKSAKSVIEYENKVDGTIIGNGVIAYPCSGVMDCLTKGDWKVPFTMNVDMKDNKFRLTFSNLQLAWPPRSDSLGYHPANPGSPMAMQSDYDAVKSKLLTFGEEIRASLSKEPKDDKW
jgi:hypothetical protein